MLSKRAFHSTVTRGEMLIFVEEETREKPSHQNENQQQTQLTYDTTINTWIVN